MMMSKLQVGAMFPPFKWNQRKINVVQQGRGKNDDAPEPKGLLVTALTFPIAMKYTLFLLCVHPDTKYSNRYTFTISPKVENFQSFKLQ